MCLLFNGAFSAEWHGTEKCAWHNILPSKNWTCPLCTIYLSLYIKENVTVTSVTYCICFISAQESTLCLHSSMWICRWPSMKSDISNMHNSKILEWVSSDGLICEIMLRHYYQSIITNSLLGKSPSLPTNQPISQPANQPTNPHPPKILSACYK